MSRARRGWGDAKGSSLRRTRGTLGEKEVELMHLEDGLLLAHYKEGCSRICEEKSWLPGAGQFDPYPPAKLAKHDYAMALPYMRVRFGGTSQPTFERVYLELSGYGISHQMGKGHTTV